MQLVNSFVTNLFNSLVALRDAKREEGQTLVEYALIIALVSVALVLALGALSGGIEGVFNEIIGSFGS